MFVWTLSDAFIVAMLVITSVLVIVIGIYDYLRQRKCPHTAVHETSSCQAICRHCGKNLGFIGSWRDKQKGV